MTIVHPRVTVAKVAGHTHVTVRTGPRGADGIQGQDGEPGPPGAGLQIKGTLPAVGDLPETGAAGDAYLIDGALWVWMVDDEVWENVGPVRGPQGETGATGPGLPAGMTMVLSEDETELVVSVSGTEKGRIKLYE